MMFMITVFLGSVPWSFGRSECLQDTLMMNSLIWAVMKVLFWAERPVYTKKHMILYLMAWPFLLL